MSFRQTFFPKSRGLMVYMMIAGSKIGAAIRTSGFLSKTVNDVKPGITHSETRVFDKLFFQVVADWWFT